MQFDEQQARAIIERTLHAIRSEYTVMPRFAFHQPLDYYIDTKPARFEAPVWVSGEKLPLPPAAERMGYSADNADYLDWGYTDQKYIAELIKKHLDDDKNLSILDFGCSSGRVLRHFHGHVADKKWRLFGVDVQARPIQWMREHFPKEFCVYTGSVIPTAH